MEALTKNSLIILMILPALMVLISVGLVIYFQQKKSKSDQQGAFLKARDKQVLPIVFTAYERAILFLERIRPQNILPHAESLQDPAKVLQLELVSTIREEYEHNLSQQLYIQPESWDLLVQAKEQVITLINLSANEVDENASGMELGKIILEKVSTSEELFIQKAIIMLKRDFQKYIPSL
ncbi:MAG: hypothetical protein AAF694_01540 [Bacteroidota bacterium]